METTRPAITSPIAIAALTRNVGDVLLLVPDGDHHGDDRGGGEEAGG